MIVFAWRPGWELAPWWQWLISLGTFGLAVALLWTLAKRRYVARFTRRQAAASAVVDATSVSVELDDDDDVEDDEKTYRLM